MVMKNQSLFFKLFFVLILFITIPVISVASLISYEMTRYSEDIIGKSAISKLKTADKLTELTSANFTQRALEMTRGSSLTDLNGMSRFDEVFSSPDAIMKLYDVQTELGDLANSNASLHSVYLYIEGADYIMTSNRGTQDIEQFADTGWMAYYERLKKTQTGSNWMSTRTVRYTRDSTGELGASNKVITFFYNFTPYTTTVKGVLVFNIYEPSMRDIINNDSTLKDGHIRIVNTSGYIISDIEEGKVGTNINSQPYFQKIKENTSNEGYLITTDQNERLLISYYKSDFNNWIYLGIFRANALMEKINTLRSYTIFICLVLILVGVLISYFASKKIYNPLKNLLQDIQQKRGIDIRSNDSDMAILSKAYDNLLRDRDRLSSIIEHKDSNKNIYLTSLLKGENGGYFDKELTGIDFSFSSYICAVIQIDRYKEFEKAYTKEQQDYMRMFILKISEELLNADLKCAGMVYEKRKIALIVNYKNYNEVGVKKVLEGVFVQIQNETGKIMDYTVSVGVGNCQESAEGIGESFDRALEALRHKLINGYGSINFWDDASDENFAYYYPFVHEKYIFNILNAGIKDKLADVITELVQEIKDNRDLHYDNVIQIFNQLIGNTVKYLLDAHYNVSMIFGNNYNIYNALSSKETLDEVKEWLISVYTQIADYLAKSRNPSKNHFERALEYIHENYKREIDINSVAEYAGVSYSHLRKIFRDEAGENIVNYINNLRINESKRLLCSTDQTIREISAALGYNSDQSFVRFFKKYEGITPGEFRYSGKSGETGARDVSGQ
jgi:AraC-like DNA-binding protein